MQNDGSRLAQAEKSSEAKKQEIRELIAKHDPALLELLDSARDVFGDTRLVFLSVADRRVGKELPPGIVPASYARPGKERKALLDQTKSKRVKR